MISLNPLRLGATQLAFTLACAFAIENAVGQTVQAPSYQAVDGIFVKHCLDCHSHDEPDAGLNLESYESFLDGGQNGSPVIAKDSARSPLVRLLNGFKGPNNKLRIMPPGRREKLDPSEIALVKAWIDEGALPPPADWQRELELDIPTITPLVNKPLPIHALAYSKESNRLAVGRYQKVELIDPTSQSRIGALEGHKGNVNDLAFDPTGGILFSGAGEAGRFGEITKWDIHSRKKLTSFRGHRDSVYALAISHDGKLLATGSYDQSIQIWNTSDGTPLRTLSGHQGAVFDLDFRADDQVLASASADRTIKLWDVNSGNRLDTLSQPLKEQHAVQFNLDGSKLFAAGVDNRIRVWSISPSARETTNSLLETRYAHEGTILQLTLSESGKRLASTATDHSVKIWDTDSLKEHFLFPKQSDWSPALAFINQDRQIGIGRLDGTLDYYQSDDGEKVQPPKPVISRVIPPGIERGTTTQVRIEGKHLQSIRTIEFASEGIHAAVIPESRGSSEFLDILVFSKETIELGPHKLIVENAQGRSNEHMLHIDRLPQLSIITRSTNAIPEIPGFPINIWGRMGERAQTDTLIFQASAGQKLVFDTAASQLGFKPDLVLTLAKQNGDPILSSQAFDRSVDPLLFYEFEETAQYQIKISERLLRSSDEHFYRLSIGEFPYVTDTMPRMVPRNETVELELVGYNLTDQARLSVKTGNGDQQEVPLDRERFRFRERPNLKLADWVPNQESEPNNAPKTATVVAIGHNIAGRIQGTNGLETDVDFFRFSAREGQSLIIETLAEQLGSPLDTRIEILDSNGDAVQRLLLEATRDTAITFRPITSTAGGVRLDHWEEMSLNDYLFMNGEVVKLFLAPRGPDSSWDFYPAQGTRRTYFDTTPTAHANFEPCYIVRVHPPGANPIPNGLPRFPIYYENDDHSEANKGRDSRVYFDVPKTGDYLVRVVDTRQLESHRFVYQLLIRERSPDFGVTISNRNPSINRGSGRTFTLNRQRVDGFDGEINVEITNLPEGLTVSSPIIIEAGHHRATGTLFVEENTAEISPLESLSIEVTASARVSGKERIKTIQNFGKIKVTAPPKLFVKLEPSPRAPAPDKESSSLETSSLAPIPPVITIQAGTTIPANLNVQRAGHDERITFSVSNLPHGVIVDNIGLNGVLMPPEVSEREIFLTAAPWVGATERLCHAIANEAGGQTSRPVILRVINPNEGAGAKK